MEDTFDFILGDFMMNVLADFQPTHPAFTLELTETDRHPCYNQIIYDDARVEGDEYFDLSLMIHMLSTADAEVDPVFGSSLARIIDNDGEFHMKIKPSTVLYNFNEE